VRIARVEAIPLTAPLPRVMVTAQDTKSDVSIVLVRVETDDGIVGWGEVLGRWTPRSYASIVSDLLAPKLIGRDPFDTEALWTLMNGSLSGRGGGMLVESIAGVDIALWDVMARSRGVPIHRLLADDSRQTIRAYASSIFVEDDNATRHAAEELAATRFRAVKLKVGGDLDTDMARVAMVRSILGPEVELYVDANWAYTVDQALAFGDRAAAYDVAWLEEPLPPTDREGYLQLGARSSIPIAAGESEYTAAEMRDLLTTRSLAYAQPDVSRAGGITESRRIAALANSFGIRFAPHIGFSGIVCLAATMQLSAAMPNFHTLEAMIFANPLREELATTQLATADQLTDAGEFAVPQGPGLGIELDLSAIERYRLR
jgi:L-alanine-DL-glutamate epimerase-like enolase superfamily enzyme